MGSDKPKSMLSLNGEPGGPTFLERQLQVLQESGVAEVVVVLSAQVASEVTIEGAKVVVNEFDTSATGSTLSLLCALEAETIDLTHGLLVSDADLVYEAEMMSWIVDHCDQSAVFVTPNTASDDEEVAVWGDLEQRPLLMGKGFPAELTDRYVLLGESLGSIHLGAPDRSLFRATARWLAGWPPAEAYGYAQAQSQHEEVWQYGFTMGAMGATIVPDHFLYSECDTPEDYRYVREELYPAITAKDQARATAGEDSAAT